MFPISVVVTTYNRPRALELVLRALDAQSDKNFEVIVGDDGSKAPTRELIDNISSEVSYPLTHVWQEDLGFRAGRVRNLAAKASQGQYLLFLDGDCIPRTNWISVHRRLAQRGWFVAGNRVLLSENFTSRAESEKIELHSLSKADWKRMLQDKNVNRIHPLNNLPLGVLRLIRASQWKRVRSCNLGIWRQDFLAVDGFDLTFEGWGFEDSDLAIRLINSGIHHKDGSYATAVLHLYHKESDRSRENENYQKLLERISKHTQKAAQGLSAI
jgi:glycosyltransferase involved in cell wall biosynthesis